MIAGDQLPQRFESLCENLYVVDASVMPTIPRAMTHLSTIAIAERAAEWI